MSVSGESTLSRSGSATLLTKPKGPSNANQKSHIHFGTEPHEWETCASDSYGPKPPRSKKEVGAFAENKKYLRGVHWTLGGDTDGMGVSTAKDAFAAPPPAPRDGQFGDKTSNQKTQWSLGFDNAPDHYETCHQAELSEPALLRGPVNPKADVGQQHAVQMARATTITLGSDTLNYQSQTRSSHIDFGRQCGADPGLATERCKTMRVSNFTFGETEEKLPATESQNQYKFHGDPAWLKGQIVAEIPGGGQKGLQKTHLLLGTAGREMQSEMMKQYGQVDALMEAAKHPCCLDPAQKADLRAQHFYLGTDDAVCRSEAAESFGARASRLNEKELMDERTHLLAVRKDLRATHINLGNDDVKDITSTAKESYSNPIGKPVGGRMEVGVLDKAAHRNANWSVGIDNDSLRAQRCTTMQHQDMADGVAQVNYGQLASMDEATKADLRKSHFYFGKESFPKQSASREAFIHHKDSKRYVIPEEVMTDLRKEHFTFGTDGGLGSNSKTTAQSSMIYHGAQAYKQDTNSAAAMKKKWASSNFHAGSHDGPRLSVQQSDFRYRPGL